MDRFCGYSKLKISQEGDEDERKLDPEDWADAQELKIKDEPSQPWTLQSLRVEGDEIIIGGIIRSSDGIPPGGFLKVYCSSSGNNASFECTKDTQTGFAVREMDANPETIIATDGMSGCIWIFDRKTLSFFKKKEFLQADGSSSVISAMKLNGFVLVTAHRSARIRKFCSVHLGTTGSLRLLWQVQHETWTMLSLYHDEKYVVCGSYNQTQVLASSDGSLLHSFPAVKPLGLYSGLVVMADEDKRGVRVWDPTLREGGLTRKCISTSSTPFRFAGNEKTVAISCLDDSIHVFSPASLLPPTRDSETGGGGGSSQAKLRTYRLPRRPYNLIWALEPDGNGELMVCSASTRDDRILVWRLR